ncbi:hypothetical protein [Pseudoalteromonas luteoviolacea]|uniref:hypothetical protein n=1 Tax=Pseudoalteromonas luteoviolacea TaxID=43657 RepID=UPI0008596369|nr:hypothetical protein [Pseudoalteromonas luteoviolacea]AOT10852.1 hypothetical protein S4054249_23690 [Pseudoalteromonas luteoviolacea]AOT15986.1 hypothetical protein S40542_24820 [Pseudoalteromonas luteoviolacea]AOT20673.1 hypothetical protein S4054_23610 [Pseudoalteromonas luteoviolacea]
MKKVKLQQAVAEKPLSYTRHPDEYQDPVSLHCTSSFTLDPKILHKHVKPPVGSEIVYKASTEL